MVNRFFIEKINDNFPYSFTNDQQKALDKIADFLFSGIADQLFLLTGYAGTGKSSLIGSLVRTMTQFRQKTILLAPTGRAAKVFSGYAAQQAFTIHKKIYRQQKFAEGTPNFTLAENLHKHTLFIVDEVQTGIGRTGYKFAYQGVGLDPDIVTSAKALANGLPVGAMIGKANLGPAFGPGSHGSTFAGNPLTMAAAQAVLTQLTPAFLDDVQEKSAAAWDQLDHFEDLKVVKSVSGRGLMIGIHLTDDLTVNDVIKTLHQKGLLTLPAVGNTLRLLPPLVMSKSDLLSGLQTIYQTLEEK